MKPRLKVIAPVVVLLCGLAAAAAIVSARPEPEARERPVIRPLVRTVPVERSDVRLAVHTQGTVAPRAEIDLVPEVSGRVVGLLPGFSAGAFFARDDILLEIDPRDYELAVRRAEAEVAQARTALAREEAEAEVARREWRSLGSGVAPPLVVREPQVAQARAALDAARAGLEESRLALERTVIRAPFDGRIREERIDVGQFIAAGTAIGRVYAIDVAEVRLPLPNEELAHLDLPLDFRNDGRDAGPVVELSAMFAGRRATWTGRIVRTEGQIDPQSRMVHAIAEVVDPYGRQAEHDRPPLAVGLFVQAEVHGLPLTNVVLLPRGALRGRDEVLVVDDEDRLRIRKVEVLRVEARRIIVAGGLAAGERVCVSSIEVVVDGMSVRAVDAVDRDGETAGAEAR